jgi:hypothetical protein
MIRKPGKRACLETLIEPIYRLLNSRHSLFHDPQEAGNNGHLLLLGPKSKLAREAIYLRLPVEGIVVLLHYQPLHLIFS